MGYMLLAFGDFTTQASALALSSNHLFMPLLAFGDFTNTTFLVPGLIATMFAIVAAIGMTTRKQGDSVSFEMKKAGTLLLPNMGAFWFLGFDMGLIAPLIGVVTFAFCATDGLPFGRVLTATTNAAEYTVGGALAAYDRSDRARKKNILDSAFKSAGGIKEQIEANRRATAHPAANVFKRKSTVSYERPWAVTSKNTKDVMMKQAMGIKTPTNARPSGATAHTVASAMNDLRMRIGNEVRGSKAHDTLSRGFAYNVNWMKRKGIFKPYKGPLGGKEQ